jgi:hypothetical protein
MLIQLLCKNDKKKARYLSIGIGQFCLAAMIIINRYQPDSYEFAKGLLIGLSIVANLYAVLLFRKDKA